MKKSKIKYDFDASKGFVSLWRKSMESSVWNTPNYWYVWCWCIMRANRKCRTIPFDGEDIIIERGQFITGRNNALEELPGITAQKWRTIINYLKSTQRIKVKVTNKFTIITVCKYSDYQKQDEESNQVNNQPVTNQQPTSNQPVTTDNNNNNANNVNNDNKEIPEPDKPTDIKPDFLLCLIEEFKSVFPDYVITTPGKEKAMAGKLLSVWKKNNPELKSEEMLQSLHNYFERCKNIDDPWHKDRMSLAHMVSQYNTIANILKAGPKKRKLSGQQDLTEQDHNLKPSDV
jgi:hypothetical protein